MGQPDRYHGAPHRFKNGGLKTKGTERLEIRFLCEIPFALSTCWKWAQDDKPIVGGFSPVSRAWQTWRC